MPDPITDTEIATDLLSAGTAGTTAAMSGGFGAGTAAADAIGTTAAADTAAAAAGAAGTTAAMGGGFGSGTAAATDALSGASTAAGLGSLPASVNTADAAFGANAGSLGNAGVDAINAGSTAGAGIGAGTGMSVPSDIATQYMADTAPLTQTPDITNSVLADSAAGTTGYGASSAGAGGAPGISTAQDLIDRAPAFLQTALKAGNTALPYASLGLNVMNMKNQQDYAKSIAANAQQSGNVGSQLLSDYQAGQLSGADQQAIVQYEQQQTAAVNQYYAKAGLSNSSMHTQALQQVQQQAETMRQQALQNMLKSGLSATGTTNQALTAAAQAQLASNKDTSQALSDFMTALSKMNMQPAV